MHRPEFQPAAGAPHELQLPGATDWAIAARPDGALLSADWLAGESEHPAWNSYAIRFRHATDDAQLVILILPLGEEDRRKTLFTLAQRGLAMLRTSLSADGLAVSTRRAIAAFPVAHAQAADAIYETWRPGDEAPVNRVYFAWVRPYAAPYYLGVWFEAPPGEFETSLAEVSDLARRIVVHKFGDAPATPALPAVPALPPAPAPPGDDPAPPRAH